MKKLFVLLVLCGTWASAQMKPAAPVQGKNSVIHVQASSNHGINFAWTEASTPGVTVTGFNLYCGTVSGQEPTTPTVAAIVGSPYLWLAGTPGTTYFCNVTAVSNIGQESGPSNEASATFPTPPQTPGSFTATVQ